MFIIYCSPFLLPQLIALISHVCLHVCFAIARRRGIASSHCTSQTCEPKIEYHLPPITRPCLVVVMNILTMYTVRVLYEDIDFIVGMSRTQTRYRVIVCMEGPSATAVIAMIRVCKTGK